MSKIEEIARAIYDAPTKFDGDTIATHLCNSMMIDGSAKNAGDLLEIVRGVCRDAARAAVEAMRESLTLEMLLEGAHAIALHNIEADGPAKPRDECKTPDDWMGRGANIAGRMVSGAEAAACWQAMIDAILSEDK